MGTHSKEVCRLVSSVLLALVLPLSASADDIRHDADHTVTLFKKTDPAIARFFGTARGYAVFPTVYKAGVEIGGAYGKGILYEKGKAIGEATLMQATVGFQLGGQAYSEIIFFETEETLSEFKQGQFALAAQVSAVAAAEGVAKNAKYRLGVAVFTIAKGGFMYEAAVGGQKFSFKPFGKS